jgi:hypothetical protein
MGLMNRGAWEAAMDPCEYCGQELEADSVGCDTCGGCERCCVCDEFDRDELGEDPEDDNAATEL